MTVGALATAAVDVIANLDTFEPDLKRKLESAVRSVSKSVEKAFDKLGAKAGKAFSDAASKVAESSSSFDDVGRAAERMERTTVSAAKGMSDGFKLPMSDVQKLERLVQQASDSQSDALGKVRVAEVQLAEARQRSGEASSAAIAAEERLSAAQRAAARDSKRLLDVTEGLVTAREAAFRNAGERAGEAAGDGFGGGFRRTARKSADDGGDESGGLFARAFETAASRALGSGLLKVFGAGLASAVTAATPLSTVLGGATAAAVALAGALAQASGAALSLGGVLGSLGLAAVAVKVGTQGVSDAFKEQAKALAEMDAEGKVSEATQKKLDQALKNLAPSAAATVVQLGKMQPAWEAVRKAVQGNLFRNIAPTIASLGKTFLPILQVQLGGAAARLNEVAVALGKFLTSSRGSSQVNGVFSSLNRILGTLLPVVVPLSAAFLNLFRASLPFAQQLANVLQSLGLDLAKFLNQAVSGGGFAKFLEGAMQAAGNLFQLLGNIGRIIGTVFSAGAASGGNLLSLLRDLTGTLAQFLQSAQGQQALTNFFSLISAAGSVLIGVFNTLGPLVGGLASVFQALQGPLRALGTTIAPVVAQLSLTLGAALDQLAPALAQIVTGLTPLVGELGGAFVAILQSLLTAALPLVPVFAQIVTQIAAGLVPIIAQLVPVILIAADNFGLLVQALLPMVPTFLTLLPPLAQLSLSMAQLVVQLTPLIQELVPVFINLLVQLTPAILAVVPALIAVVNGTTQIINALTRLTGLIVSFTTTSLSLIVGWVSGMISSFGRLASGALSLVTRFTQGAVNAFRTFVANVGSVMSQFASVVSSGVSRAVSFFAQLPGKVASAVAGMGAALFAAGSAAVQGLVNGIQSKAGAVLSAAQDLAAKVKSGIGNALKIFSPSRVTRAQGEFAGQGLADGIRSKVRTVAEAAARLANAVPKTVESAFSKLQDKLATLPPIVRKAVTNSTAAIRDTFKDTAAASDDLGVRLSAAQKNLQSLLEKSRQLAQSVAQSLVQAGNVTAGQDQSFKSIVSRLSNAVTSARQFNSVLAQLQKAGLNKTSLQQIIDAGAETGLAAGKAILGAGASGVAQINALQARLQAAANQAAKTASTAIFGQGIQIANGIVAGLTRQKAALDKQMLRLGDILAQRVLTVLRQVKFKGSTGLNIPAFKDGAIVNSPTVALFGEAGREAAVPIDRPDRALEIMDKAGLTKLVLERLIGDASVSSSSRKTKEFHVGVNVGGAIVSPEALAEAIAEVLRTRFGLKPAMGIQTAGGVL